MQRLIEKLKKPTTYVIIVLTSLLIFGIATEYRLYMIKHEIRSNIGIARGKITSFEKAYRSTGYYLDYYFTLNGRRYNEDVQIHDISYDCVKSLVGQTFLVVYSEINPENNQMLIKPRDYFKYDLHYSYTSNKCLED